MSRIKTSTIGSLLIINRTLIELQLGGKHCPEKSDHVIENNDKSFICSIILRDGESDIDSRTKDKE